jgi:dihydrodiol dehydrogenase / D-xylose 1-dehydrogenase (NADP)
MADKIRWGIIGTGWVAKEFATGLTVLPEAELVAVGSRTAESANQFADMFGVPHRHASYEALVNDPNVDVVYVATPHILHKENSLLGLQAGKAVLCEKPFTINAAEAEAVIQFARGNKLFLMEAMWTRFIPLVVKVRQLLADRVIGDVQMLVADLGFLVDFDPLHRLFDPQLGGGALLDLGIYPVSLASMIFGPPSRITSMAQLGETGVDEQAAIILGYGQGQLATLYTSHRTDTPREAILLGTKGRIRIHPQMFRPTKLTLSLTGQEDNIIEMPLEGNGYNYQAAEVMRCLQAGKLESDAMPLDETLAIMKTMDQIRAQWGLKYPME